MKRKTAFLAIIYIMAGLFMDFFTMQADASTQEGLLKKLTVANGEMVQFEEGVYTYSVQLDAGETRADIMAVPESSSYVVQIEGNEELSSGQEQVVSIYVYDTQGNSEVYELKVYAASDETEAALAYITCVNGLISPNYRKSARRYYIILEYDQTAAELDIRTSDPDSSVKITGNTNLEAGKRTKADLVITDPDGSEQVYELFIYRKNLLNAPVDPGGTLSSLVINSGTVPLEFDRYTFYYELNVPSSVESLDISASAESEDNIVRVYGAAQLNQGEANIISIVVHAPDKEGISIYTLSVTRDSFWRTRKFTALQVAVFCLVPVLTALASAGFAVFIVVRYMRFKATGKPGHTMEKSDADKGHKT